MHSRLTAMRDSCDMRQYLYGYARIEPHDGSMERQYYCLAAGSLATRPRGWPCAPGMHRDRYIGGGAAGLTTNVEPKVLAL